MQLSWVDVKGYEGIYQVNQRGDVRSLKRKSPGTNTTKDTILKKYINKKGYYFYSLSKKGLTKKYLLHRLIALHFIYNPNEYNIVNHKDGNPLNNDIKNLEWCTMSHNVKHGYDYNGRKNPNRKLSEDEVKEIKNRMKEYKYGMGRMLAKEYGVSVWIISLIRKNKTYKLI